MHRNEIISPKAMPAIRRINSPLAKQFNKQIIVYVNKLRNWNMRIQCGGVLSARLYTSLVPVSIGLVKNNES